jgi:hypothetical protein
MLANKAIMEKMAADRELEQQEKYLLAKRIEYEEMKHHQKLERFKDSR